MQRVALLLASVAVLALLFGPSHSVDAAADATTMVGEYHWSQGGARGGLKAVFEPTGEGTWDVSFHFDFESSPHTYTGTASGSLTNGKLSGEVTNENKRRTYAFEGTVENGNFAGQHSETTKGRTARTGTLSLSSS